MGWVGTDDGEVVEDEVEELDVKLGDEALGSVMLK